MDQDRGVVRVRSARRSSLGIHRREEFAPGARRGASHPAVVKPAFDGVLGRAPDGGSTPEYPTPCHSDGIFCARSSHRVYALASASETTGDYSSWAHRPTASASAVIELTLKPDGKWSSG
jgi:hypothetical protein